MSYARASIVYELEKILKKIRKGLADVKEPVTRIGAKLLVLPMVMGERFENYILEFADMLARKVNEAQRSIEESLTMSSLYIGFLLTTAIVLATVILYVARY